jgi:hypothetical protein
MDWVVVEEMTRSSEEMVLKELSWDLGVAVSVQLLMVASGPIPVMSPDLNCMMYFDLPLYRYHHHVSSALVYPQEICRQVAEPQQSHLTHFLYLDRCYSSLYL